MPLNKYELILLDGIGFVIGNSHFQSKGRLNQNPDSHLWVGFFPFYRIRFHLDLLLLLCIASIKNTQILPLFAASTNFEIIISFSPNIFLSIHNHLVCYFLLKKVIPLLKGILSYILAVFFAKSEILYKYDIFESLWCLSI